MGALAMGAARVVRMRPRYALVLMGSMTVDLPVSYMQLMINSLEIIGNFMHPADAYRKVLAMVRGGPAT
jgi:alcohol dehydrogenase